MSDKVANEIRGIIDTRIAAANEDENAGLAKKWMKEQKVMTSTAFAKRFAEFKGKPAIFTNMAIYAAQKVRKLLVGSVDGYTRNIVLNAAKLAKAKVPFTQDLQLAALSTHVECGGPVAKLNRMSSTRGTASTQASSTRKALVALGFAKVVTKDGAKVLELDFENEIIKGIVDA